MLPLTVLIQGFSSRSNHHILHIPKQCIITRIGRTFTLSLSGMGGRPAVMPKRHARQELRHCRGGHSDLEAHDTGKAGMGGGWSAYSQFGGRDARLHAADHFERGRPPSRLGRPHPDARGKGCTAHHLLAVQERLASETLLGPGVNDSFQKIKEPRSDSHSM